MRHPKSRLPGSLGGSIKGSLEGSLKGSIKGSLKSSLKNSLKDSFKSALKGSLKYLRTRPLLVALVFLLLPLSGQASYPEVSRLATQLSRLSEQVSVELRHAAGYNSVQFSALRLSREAQQLVEAVVRARQYSFVSAQFNELSQRFRDLQKTFSRANGGEHSPALIGQIQQLTELHDQLQVQVVQSGERYRSSRDYVPPVIVVPQVNVQGGHGQHWQNTDPRHNGQIRLLPRESGYSHRSAVLERQQRQDQQQRSIDRQMQRRHGTAAPDASRQPLGLTKSH